MLCALMLSIAPTAAQKITIDEVTKPYDAKTRSSGQMDRQLMVLALGVLGVLIIGSAIYLFSTRTQRKQKVPIPPDRKVPIPPDRKVPIPLSDRERIEREFNKVIHDG